MEKIKSLQALRGLAFLGHVGSKVEWGTLGASLFFCLSGFLLMYRAGNERTVCTIKDSLQFAKDKLKKIYPLHIITMVIVIAYNVAEIIYWKNPLLTFGRFIIPGAVLNITLLQCWIPDDRVNIILNPVSWYLSTAAFLYFIFPYVCKYVRAKSYKKSITVCGLILLGEIFCVPSLSVYLALTITAMAGLCIIFLYFVLGI